MSGRVLDFTVAMRRLCQDMVVRLPQLRHIDIQRVAIGLCQARKNVSHGIYAALTPLRFAGGKEVGRIDGRRYGVSRLDDATDREYLYLLTFYLPRFMNTSLEEKLSTVVHELWHISPLCDGDLRRHQGRCYAHGRSQRDYDAAMDRLGQAWLALDPPHHLYEFLENNFDETVAEHGKIVGTHWPAPKLLPRLSK